LVQESLRDWLKQKWVRIDADGDIAGPCGKSKKQKNPARCLPLNKAKALTKNQRAKTNRKKKAGGRKGKQFVSNTQAAKVREAIQELISAEKILKSFDYKSKLCPAIFDQEKVMHKEVRKQLLKIVKAFIDFLDIELKIKDIILTGSLANYNWSDFSDVDLHILVDFSSFTTEEAFIKGFFDSKRRLWNKNYPIKVKGFDVELYVQDVKEQHTASGQYSIAEDRWVLEPEREGVEIDYEKIKDKAASFIKDIKDLEDKSMSESSKLKEIERIKDKLKQFRRAGLEKGGEFSYENLAFKFLRRGEYLQKLANLESQYTTQAYTLSEKTGEKDYCYYKAKKIYGNKTSAYRSLYMEKCRKKNS
jgi:predicted nucleotidyltransferase